MSKFGYTEVGVIADVLNKEATKCKNSLCKKLGFVDLNANINNIRDIKLIIIIGGDGFFLHATHRFLSFDVVFYGINYGTLGFLLNSKCSLENLLNNIEMAEEVQLPLLKAEIVQENKIIKCYAINEISLFRATGQVIKIKIFIDGKLRMEELVADGIVLSTPAGSTAYNFSLHGPILPPDSNLLSLCPVSPFRPRHWRGSLISESSKVTFEVLESSKRPVVATADFHHFDKTIKLDVALSKKKAIRVLFNKSMPLKEKIIVEQFLI